MDKFIFSTKFCGNYSLMNKAVFEKDSKILNYTACHKYSQDIFKLFINNYVETNTFIDLISTLKEKCNTLYPNKYDVFFEKIGDKNALFESVKRIDDIKICLAMASELPRFSYYTFEAQSNDGQSVVFAVPDWGRQDREWIKALILDNTGSGIRDGDNLYLILHDKDVPGYNGKSFLILTNEQIINLGVDDVFKKENNIVGCNIHIIVFNHVRNAIVSLLKKENLMNSDVADGIRSIFRNKDLLMRVYKGDKSDLSNLDVNGDVDLGDGSFDFTKVDDKGGALSGSRKIHRYKEENGALLTELMHVRPITSSSDQFKNLIKYLSKPAWDDTNKTIDVSKKDDMRFPIIIQLYKSFFKDWENAVASDDDKEIIRNHHNKKALEENLERVFSFFNNSSIWVRLVDMYDKKAYDAAVAEFEYFDNIGLYDYASAWENLEHNLRLFEHNYLESSLDGHGNYVTPVLFGNETEACKILSGNHNEMK